MWESSERRVSSNHYLPSELMMEVLARLPVKSLFRFKSVSKSWRDLIANPNFISLHLNYNNNTHNNNNSDQNFRILTVEDGTESNKEIKIHLVDKFEESAVLMDVPSSLPLGGNDSLILMLNTISKELMLVNPSIKKLLQLPTCPIPHSISVVYALGFSSTINDYKVFAFRFPHGNYVSSFAVYAHREGCWSIKDINFEYNFRLNLSNALYTKGNAHWLAEKGGIYSYSYYKLISFDLDAERFSFMCLPDYEDRIDGIQIRIYMDLFSLRGSVAIVCVSFLGSYIWIMDKGDKTWTKLYYGVPSRYTLFCFLNFSMKKRFWFDEKSGNFYLHADETLWLYDIRGDEIHDLGRSFQWVRHVDAYVESLLLL